MKAIKKLLSGIVVLTMMCSSVAAVCAEDIPENDTMVGLGKAEGYVDKGIRKVVLPTSSLAFVIDPQGLIKGSGSAATKYKAFTVVNTNKDGSDRSEGFVYFTSKVPKGTALVDGMSNYVDLTVENKSPFNVKITPVITYTDGKTTINENGKATTRAMGCVGEVNKAESVALGKNNLRFNLWVKGEPASSGTPATYTIITDKTVVTKELGNLAQFYKYTYANDQYGYTLDESTTGYNPGNKNLPKDLNNKVTYTIEGISNPAAANWTAVMDSMNTESNETTTVQQPEIKVKWTIADVK
jgi:hypothetical protein